MRTFLHVVVILSLLFGEALSQPLPPGGPRMVITEIMFDLPGNDLEHLEFIEVTNPNPFSTLPLQAHAFTSGIEFQFPLGYMIGPKASVIIARDSVAFEAAFGVPAFQWNPGFELSDEGATIVLTYNGQYTNDSVRYSNNILWPIEAMGNGASIVLCNDTIENAGPTNWTAATSATGLTLNSIEIFAHPGDSCSGPNSISETDDSAFLLFPNPNRGMFTLMAPASFSGGPHRMQVTDLSGKLLHSEDIDINVGDAVHFQLSLPSGVHLLSLIGTTTVFQQRLVTVE